MSAPAEDQQAELRELFALPDGVERLKALFTALAQSPQTTEFVKWFLHFCTEQLEPGVWADRAVLTALLASRLDEEGFDVVEYLCRATCAAPELAEDKELFEASLKVCVSSVNAFKDNFLTLPESRATLVVACRDCKIRTDGFDDWRGRFWPLDNYPLGFLASLPSAYCEKQFLLAAAVHVEDAGVSFRRLPAELRSDREVAIAFAQKQTGILECLPDALLRDREVLRAGLNEEPRALLALPKELWRDEELAQVAALKWGATFFSSEVGKLHHGCKALVLIVAASDFNTLFFVPRFYGCDAEVVEVALTSSYARWASANERRDARHASRLLRLAWDEVVAESLKADAAFLLRLLASNGSLLRLCPESQRTDLLFVAAAVASDASVLGDVGDGFWRPGKRRRLEGKGDAKRCCAEEAVDSLARRLLNINLECWLYLPSEVKARLQLEAFECCVCYKLPDREIRQCIEGGHLICRECAEKLLNDPVVALARCPVCRCVAWVDRASGPDDCDYGARNRFAEKELAKRLAAPS